LASPILDASTKHGNGLPATQTHVTYRELRERAGSSASRLLGLPCPHAKMRANFDGFRRDSGGSNGTIIRKIVLVLRLSTERPEAV